MQTDKHIKNITRHCTTSGQGWLVRVMSLGTTNRKYFADGTYGGRMKALNAAVKHRNRLVRVQQDGRLRA